MGEVVGVRRPFIALQKAIDLFQQREIAVPEHGPLCEKITLVLRDVWAAHWGQDSAMKSLLNKNTLYHEIDEYVVPVFRLIKCLEESGLVPGQKIALVDVASGKGILSLLISSLSLYYPVLRHIQSILMLDKNKTMNLSHLERIAQDGQAAFAPIPVSFEYEDLHQKGEEPCRSTRASGSPAARHLPPSLPVHSHVHH